MMSSIGPDKMLKNLRENNYFPSMMFFYKKSLFIIVFGQNIFNCQPIFKIIVANFRTNEVLKFARKIFCLH